LTFAVRERDRRMAESLLREAGVVSTCFILVHVGSGTEVKRLPPERWAMIVDHVRKFVHAHVVVTSGNHPDERATARALCDKTAAILLAPPQSFGALGAVMQRARVSIGADSGAMHLAVAVGCPSVTLFGPADPTVFGPWGDPSRHAIVKSGLICSPCDVLDWPPAQVYYHPCMRRLEPEVVARAAARVAPAEPLGNE
jgi:heptosyltransferase-2/heptosyltransferase-3